MKQHPHSTSTVNPFYSERSGKASTSPHPRYAKLPRTPITGSPVPRLTSLYHFDAKDRYGDRSYPGNCGGALIRDLLLYFRPQSVFDPMTGSGTCAEVCSELKVPCLPLDIHSGFNATSPDAFCQEVGNQRFDFVWAHPPYWRQKLYTTHEGDLSRTSTLDAFLDSYASFINNCASVLSPGGKLAILMGDYADREAGFVSLTYHTKLLAHSIGLRQHCTDIIRFSHGASSSRKTYRSSFIPGLHDVCMIFERPQRPNRQPGHN